MAVLATRGIQSVVTEMAETGCDREVAEKHGWTPLIMASKGGFIEVVTLLLAENPNVNALDQDGRSALAWSAKEGHNEIVVKLLLKGAFLNMPDRHGDSPLILATKEGHAEVVHTLIASYADIEMVDAEGKTPLYISVEKGHAGVLNELLLAGANTETVNKDGETAIFRGIKKKNTQCVKLLLEKGANIDITDKNGDNVLHLIVRNRCVRMCELLLNDSKHVKLLHQQNKNGETPYSIDRKNKHEMLTQICNDAQINPNEYDKMDLGTQQDILLTTLSKFLVEPSLSTPMTIGLYSRWGSGKSAYIQRLAELLQEYRDQSILRPFTITLLLILGCITVGVNFGIIVWAVCGKNPGMISGISVAVFLLAVFIFIRLTIISSNYKLYGCGVDMTIFLHRIMILLKLIYCVPPSIEEFRPILPVHLVLVDLSQSAIVADSPMASLVSFTQELNDAIERDLGVFIPRLYRIFKGTPYRNRPGADLNFNPHWKVSCCCVPSFIITVFIFTCLWVGLILYSHYGLGTKENSVPSTVIAVEIACCCIFGGGLISYILRGFVMIYCMCLPMKRRIKIVSNQAGIQEETFLSVLKQELDMYVDMLECLDGFNHRQTRIIIHIDLVDSLEQQKVLSLINTINLLVTEPGHPFILVISVDPRLLIKAVDQTLSNMQGPVISPCEYLKNMVDLPFYVNEYPKLRADRLVPGELCRQLEENLEVSEDEHDDGEWIESDDLISGPSHEIENGHVPIGNGLSTQGTLERSVKFPSDESLSIDDDMHEENISEDISHLLRNNENNTLNDVKRIMNIVSLTGRLLRYHNVPFQWTRLAIWVSFCDGWPYKASWIILLTLDTSLNLPGNMSIRRLHSLFGFLMPIIGDKNLGIENSNSYFDTFIASHRPSINVNDARSFAAFIFYIDPTIRKLMIDYLLAMRSSKRSSSLKVSGMSHYNPSPNPIDHQWRNGVNPDVLVRMTVDDVASQLLEIEGMNESLLQDYKSRLIDNNVNGRVLMACELNELREAMQMKFGDWQLFKAWIIASRDKNEGVSRCDEKISTDLSMSCLDGSQSESNPGTPKQTISGEVVSNAYCLPSHSEKTNVPYASHSPRSSPQNSRKSLKLKHTKTTSVSQDSENGSPNHPNDPILHHSADSGFASTEVDQNNRLMLTLQRQMCFSEIEKATNANENLQFASIKSNIIAEHVEELNASNQMISIDMDHGNASMETPTRPDKIPEQIELLDLNDNKTDIYDKTEESNNDVINPDSGGGGTRPPSLSDVPLPPVSMLNELMSWPMIPPAEFDDNHDNQSLPSPPSNDMEGDGLLDYRNSRKYESGSQISSDCENDNLLSNEETSCSRSEPYAVEYVMGNDSSLKKSASVDYRWRDL